MKKSYQQQQHSKEHGTVDENEFSNSSSSFADECSSVGSTDDTNHSESNHHHKEGSSSSSSGGVISDSDTKKIKGLRFLGFLVLVFSVLGALAVYFYLSGKQNDEFETQFRDDAIKVLASLGSTLDYSLGAIDALAVSILSYAKATNQRWPFVTVDDFAVRASKVKTLSRGYIINMYNYVTEEQRDEWETYTRYNGDPWVEESIAIQAADSKYTGPLTPNFTSWYVIHDYDEFYKENPGEEGITHREGPYLVWWQCYPVVAYDPVYNWDAMSWAGEVTESAMTTHRVSITDAYMIAYPNETEKIKDNEQEAEWVKNYLEPGENPLEPISDIYYPLILEATDGMRLFDDNGGGKYDPTNHTFVGMVALSFFWRDMIKDILPPGSDGVVAVFENPCNPTFTYQINGNTVEYLGTGDFHDSQYDHLEQSSPLSDLRKFAIKDSGYSGIPFADDVCPFTVRVFPSDTMKDRYVNSTPIVLAVSAGTMFFVFALMFVIYDQYVERRQRAVMDSATKSAAIVRSMFPASIQKKMMQEEEAKRRQQQDPLMMSKKRRLSSFLVDGEDKSERMSMTEHQQREQKPLAELFPYCTVLFADISGFTAWSSTRDPSQVFTLLETIYKSFDRLAARKKVFKVETVGDSYVAVTGLPNKQDKHAVIMARFAAECLFQFRKLTRNLEVVLGPDTADLGLRIGLHSGPVTAGVLRGDRARFQLFGDTVNKASRMESSSHINQIQVSGITAALIVDAGRGEWLTPRSDSANAKGDKGIVDLDTYWLRIDVGKTFSAKSEMSHTSHSSGAGGHGHGAGKVIRKSKPFLSIQEHKKHKRLVTWVTDLLMVQAKKIIARHDAIGLKPDRPSDLIYHTPSDKTSLDEVVEVINMPTFDEKAAKRAKHHMDIEVSSLVAAQLRAIVARLSVGYIENAFHNFEHACHVTMSVNKFLERIVAPDLAEESEVELNTKTTLASHLHDYTHGITSDPVTVLGILFSALIHDVDHRGVSNAQLSKEDEDLAAQFRGKSVAEQNSFEIAWGILMGKEYEELRSTVFRTRSELLRFRQVVVNIVLCTDIFDKELNDLRKGRWMKAFNNEDKSAVIEDETDLRATIVIEHIMQASDVSHTMQHWHIYRKWNQCLFMEMSDAFAAGRMGKDPADFWYQGELGFFDNYILPLAQKLRDCKVFGVSSDEVLNYAKLNRAEWEARGQDVVSEMVELRKQRQEGGGRLLGNIGEEGTDDDDDESDASNDLLSGGGDPFSRDGSFSDHVSV